MTDLSQLTCTVVDTGTYLSMALRLADFFGKVRYCVPSWESSFPLWNQQAIGKGFEKAGDRGTFEVVDSYEPYRDKTDLWGFFDCCHAGVQQRLRAEGRRVWGSGRLNQLELDRDKMKDVMEQVGLPVGDYVSLRGMDALRDYLKTHRDVWVKMDNNFRGHGETFHAASFGNVKTKLEEMDHELGPWVEHLDFTVEQPLEDKQELGTDTYVIDGKSPRLTSSGVEIKGKAYVMRMLPFEDIPEPITRPNSLLAPIFAAGGYRGFFSTEIRVGKDRKPFLLEGTCRLGDPPGPVIKDVISNFGEVIYEGAGGVLIEPTLRAAYGAQLTLSSPWAEKHYLDLEIPPSMQPFVSLRNACRVDGRTYIIPQAPGLHGFGAAIGYGDTLDEAIAMCREVAESVVGMQVEYAGDAFDQAEETLEKAGKVGLPPMGE